MDLPANAPVHGSDGLLGRATQLIIDPVHMSVTHLVVRGEAGQRLAPLSLVTTTQQNRINLNCSKAQFKNLKTFTETHFVDVPIDYATGFDDMNYGDWDNVSWPYAASINHTYADEVELVPKGELAVRRGMRVDASDGQVGRVDEFVLEPKSGHIGHLVMRRGHIFGEKDVFVPVSEIARLEQDHVTLKLSKREVDGLVTIPVNRLWEGEA